MITAEQAREMLKEQIDKKYTNKLLVNETIELIEKRIIEDIKACRSRTIINISSSCSVNELNCILNKLRENGYSVSVDFDKWMYNYPGDLFPTSAYELTIKW